MQQQNSAIKMKLISAIVGIRRRFISLRTLNNEVARVGDDIHI